MLLWTELLVILALILLSGVFAGAEIALLSVRKTRLSELVADGHRAARAAIDLRQDPERMLATIQVAITVLSAATAVIGGARFEEPLAAFLSGAGVAEQYADPIAFVGVVAGISYFSLVFGELVPKSIALRKSEAVTLLIARSLVVLSRVAKPAVWLLTWSSNLVLRPLKDSTTFSESRFSPEELQQLVEEASTSGTLPPAAGEIASRAIDLAHLRVRDVMIPRQRVVAISADASLDGIRTILRAHTHSRFPVYERSIDDVLGYVTARELYEAVLDRQPLDLRKLARPVAFVPEMSEAVQAMRRLQQDRQRIGLVVDETGGVVGAVTIADVAEELIGDVLGETESPEQIVIAEPDGTFTVRGDAPIHEVERILDVPLSMGDVRASTIAGLVLEETGRIPKVGDRVRLSADIEAEVLDASERRVRTLRLHRTEPEKNEDGSV